MQSTGIQGAYIYVWCGSPVIGWPFIFVIVNFHIFAMITFLCEKYKGNTCHLENYSRSSDGKPAMNV